MTRYLLVGDSTVAACPPEEHPMSGWGPHLAAALPDGDEVINLATGGATTESFVEEGLWDAVLDACSEGDVVVIQFGHNDQKRPALDAEGGYTRRLEGFVDDVRARGVAPVLCTSVERRHFDGRGLRHSHGAYPAAVRALARRRDVPLIDLTVFTRWLYLDAGPYASAAFFTAADDTHFHEHGARKVASYVAEGLLALAGAGSEVEAMGRLGLIP